MVRREEKESCQKASSQKDHEKTGGLTCQAQDESEEGKQDKV
jgi:hypothetical protein